MSKEKENKDDDKGLDIDEGVAEIAADLGLGEEPAGEEETEAPEAPTESEVTPDPKAAKLPKTGDTAVKPAAPAAASGESAADPAATAAAPATGDGKDSKTAIPSALPDGSPQELRTWRPEARELLKKLPPELKGIMDEVLKRERDMDEGLKKAKLGSEVADQFRTMLKPYMPTYQHYKMNPLQHIDQVLKAQMVLYFGTPEQKTAILRKAAQDFGVPFDQLTAEAPAIDPNDPATRLSQELASVSSNVKQLQQIRQQETEQRFAAEIDAFAKDPAHPHFEEVSEQVLKLLQSRACGSLQEAYESAVWSNPVTRAKLQSDAQAKAAADAEVKRKADEAARAKATAANVRARPKAAGAATPSGSMDDTMAEVLADIKGRS